MVSTWIADKLCLCIKIEQLHQFRPTFAHEPRQPQEIHGERLPVQRHCPFPNVAAAQWPRVDPEPENIIDESSESRNCEGENPTTESLSDSFMHTHMCLDVIPSFFQSHLRCCNCDFGRIFDRHGSHHGESKTNLERF